MTIDQISELTDFNPHSHKGSDSLLITVYARLVDFNPHSHKGSDEKLQGSNLKIDISIHTPTRGVTDAKC